MASRQPHLRFTLGIAISSVLAVGLAGCATAPAPEALPDTGGADFGHVHGLGYDHTTGRTYAATHNGVWLLPAGELPATFGNGELDKQAVGEPEQIASRAQDTMGFFVTETGSLLASGHPDPQEQPTPNPPNLGLITSTDGAETWTSVSLRAETDFHDLAATLLANGATRIYGYDATRSIIRISDTSGKNWSDGATVEMRDLTVDRADPDRVLVTTAAGLMISSDAARTFKPAADAPALYVIDALDVTAGGGFVGVDTGGAIWHSGTDGEWIQAGTTDGVPEALAFVGGQTPWVLYSDDRGIVASDDFGSTWTTLVGK